MTRTIHRRKGAAAAALLIGALGLGAGAAPAAAQTLEASDGDLETARNLVDVCAARGAEDLAVKARVLCYGYLTGAMQFHKALTASGEFTRAACPADTPTRRQVAAVLLTWAEGRDDLDAMTPIDALMRAAQAEWPCK
ncbi:MAG: Rap1a/Tai family immunity protein [Pseudomonadota bacterium]|nr:Rap1a/Tai family immunity protein [Pseudomonadota bacterium]